MAEREAIRRIKKLLKMYVKDEPYSEHYLYADVVKLSAEALEKQIPKAPSQLLKHKDYFDWECPKCHMTYGCCNVKVNYCYECGQAIKWG